MTKSINSTSAAAAAAAAAATAAALVGNDISWIKKDVIDIKTTLKEMIGLQEHKIDSLETKIDVLSKLIYIGVGISMTISVLLPILLKILIK